MIKENITIENLLKETEGEESYFKDFLKALLHVEHRYILYPYRGINGEDNDKLQGRYERVFAYELYHQFRKIMECNPEKYEGIFLNGEAYKGGSIYTKMLEILGGCNCSEALTNCVPDLVLHKNPGEIVKGGQYFLCEMKTCANSKFLDDFRKIKKYADSQLEFKYHIFLSIGETLNQLKKRIKNPDWDAYYLDTVCICLHPDGKHLDYALLGDICMENYMEEEYNREQESIMEQEMQSLHRDSY